MKASHFLSFAALLLLVVGCASVSRDTFVRQKTGEHVYEAKIEDVWPHVREMFEEQGYSVMNTPGEFLLETSWKEEMAGSKVAGYWHKYMAVGVPLTGGRCQVQIVRLSKSAADYNQYSESSRGASGQRSSKSAVAAEYEVPNTTPGETDNSEGYSAQSLQFQAGDQSQNALMKWTGTRDGERDFAYEFLLMQRIDPESAQEIQQAANSL